MAETTFGKVIEFLIGLIIFPIISAGISIAIMVFLGIDLSGFKSYIIPGILLMIAFSMNKVVGYGYLLTIILGFIFRITLNQLYINNVG